MDRLLISSIITGIISVVIGVTTTAIVGQFITADSLQWALIAVSFASFFSGLGGYISGQQRTASQ